MNGVVESPVPRMNVTYAKNTKSSGSMANITWAYATASASMFDGVPSSCSIWVAKAMPTPALRQPSRNVTVRLVPTTSLSLCWSFAPYAWPIKTALPLLKPMRNPIKRNKIGKRVEMAARPSTPMKRPMKMLLMVPEADWRMLLSTKGTRKRPMTCHIGRDSSKIPCRRGALEAMRLLSLAFEGGTSDRDLCVVRDLNPQPTD